MKRDIETMLDYEAKRRPQVADLLSNVNRMSDEDINNAPVLKWIKQAILSRKNKAIQADAHARLMATLEIVEGFTPDPTGEIRRWISENAYISLDRGAIEVRTNRLIWLPKTGGIWIATVFAKVIDRLVFSQSVPVRIASKSEYSRQCQDELNATYPETSKESGYASSIQGVRFFKS